MSPEYKNILEKSLESPVFVLLRERNCALCDKSEQFLKELVGDKLFVYKRYGDAGEYDLKEKNKVINALSKLILPNAEYNTILGLFYKGKLINSWSDIRERYFKEYEEALDNIILSE